MKKDEQLGVSRRSFLKGAGLAAAAMAGTAALAGCANESAGGADTLANTGDWLPQTWDYECDLLVIGYGGAGMWASLIGADECGQQVLVLEKAPERGGGNSSINNGEWTIVEESEKERFKDYIRAFTKGKTPDAMIEAWVEECARNTEYADKYGMTYEVVEQALAGAIPEYFFLDDTLCGVTLLGDTSLLGQVTEQVNGKFFFPLFFPFPNRFLQHLHCSIWLTGGTSGTMR